MVLRLLLMPHRPAPLHLGLLASLVLLAGTLPGCRPPNIYGGGPSPSPLPPRCETTFRGDWILEVADGAPADVAPRFDGATRISITQTNIVVGSEGPTDLGPYEMLGTADSAVYLGGMGPASLRVMCNAVDKLEIGDGPPGSRRWFYRRAPSSRR